MLYTLLKIHIQKYFIFFSILSFPSKYVFCFFNHLSVRFSTVDLTDVAILVLTLISFYPSISLSHQPSGGLPSIRKHSWWPLFLAVQILSIIQYPSTLRVQNISAFLAFISVSKLLNLSCFSEKQLFVPKPIHIEYLHFLQPHCWTWFQQWSCKLKVLKLIGKICIFSYFFVSNIVIFFSVQRDLLQSCSR